MENKEKTLENVSDDMEQEENFVDVPGEVRKGENLEKEQTEGGEKEEFTKEVEEIEEEEASEEKKGIFGKKKEKKDKKTEQIEELTDKLKRSMAEFDNYRKRTDKEKSLMYEIGAREIIEKILPVVDNFERGFSGVSEEEMKDPFIDGMDKVFKQLLIVMEELGVKSIESVGKTFDPNLHNAVMHMEDEELEENIIVEEFQKGYLYKETVIRHSMVKVAN